MLSGAVPIVMVRLTCCDKTGSYAARRRAEGKNNREIIRCLKRYVAREISGLLTDPPVVPNGTDLRTARQHEHIGLATAAAALDTWPTRVSELERGLTNNTDLANRCNTWLATKQAAARQHHNHRSIRQGNVQARVPPACVLSLCHHRRCDHR